jgi:hypothetical protein
MKIPYTLLDFSGEVKTIASQWDMALIKDLLDCKIWQPAQGYEFFEETDRSKIGEYSDGAITIIPARQNAQYLDKVQDWIECLGWTVLIIVGDEERSFDYTKLKHPNMKVWLMQPKLDDKADFFIGSGYAPFTRELIAQNKPFYMDKLGDWFFAGQVNHPRRKQAVDILKQIEERESLSGKLVETNGFTQGLTHDTYCALLANNKAVPCPSGIQSPDSFRVYEALEAGAVPIADDISTVLIHESGYWRKVFNGEDVPFKILDDYANLEGYILDIQREYPAYSNKVFAWWVGYKRRMAYVLNEQVHELSGIEYSDNGISNKITVIIPTSPIKSHPDTKVIDQSIRDIRTVLPECEIIIGIDGVRPEQEHYRERYEQYKRTLLWKTNYEWSNVVPVIFDEHMHQALMTKELLKMVRTPTLLFIEHDTALTPDFEFDWQSFVKVIEDGEANIIRFHFEAMIPSDHKDLMIGDVERINNMPLLKTMQWSQRPHLASTVFYKDMLERYFTDQSRTMIEDVVHGKVIEDCQNDGMMGWYKWRLWIYYPDNGNIKRSYTTDGREDDPKFEMVF